MSIFDFFRFPSKRSAVSAKERLQIVVAHERAVENNNVDFLPKLKTELLSVICKYIEIHPDQIQVSLQREGRCSVLELNVILPNENTADHRTALL